MRRERSPPLNNSRTINIRWHHSRSTLGAKLLPSDLLAILTPAGHIEVVFPFEPLLRYDAPKTALDSESSDPAIEKIKGHTRVLIGVPRLPLSPLRLRFFVGRSDLPLPLLLNSLGQP